MGPSSLRHYLLELMVLTVCVSLCFASCTDQRAIRSDILLDGLFPEMAQHLRSDDDSTFTLYAREVGIETLVLTSSHLYTKLRSLDRDMYERDSEAIFTYARKIARALETEYDYPSSAADLDFLESLTIEEQREVLVLRRRMLDVFYHKELTAEQKIEGLSEFKERLEQYGDEIYSAMCKIEIGYVYEKNDDLEMHLRYMREAVKDFERLGVHRMTCQGLGQLGAYYSEVGNVDSMHTYFEKANFFADRSRLPTQAARISTFYAGYYYRQGRLALAHDFYRQAMERCRKYKGGSIEVRYIFSAMDFYSDLECWDIVNR